MNYSPWAKFCSPPVFENKVFLEDSHIYLFMYRLWLLSHYDGRVESLWQKLSDPKSLTYLLSWPFPEKFCWRTAYNNRFYVSQLKGLTVLFYYWCVLGSLWQPHSAVGWGGDGLSGDSWDTWASLSPCGLSSSRWLDHVSPHGHMVGSQTPINKLIKLLLVSCLLVFHLPKENTWASPMVNVKGLYTGYEYWVGWYDRGHPDSSKQPSD